MKLFKVVLQTAIEKITTTLAVKLLLITGKSLKEK
jgi:hypothetical protein